LSNISIHTTAKQADRKLCTDGFSRQVNFILIFK